MFPLGLLASGEKGEVVEKPSGGGYEYAAGHCSTGSRCGSCTSVRIADMGLRPGKAVEMLNNEGGGALLVKVDEARIAVGRSMAMRIMVRRTGDEPGNA